MNCGVYRLWGPACRQAGTNIPKKSENQGSVIPACRLLEDIK